MTKWMLVALFAVASWPALAQAPTPAPSPAVEAAPGTEDEGEAMPMAPPSPDESIKGLLGEDLETHADGYQYVSAGRRDPFVSLQRPVQAGPGMPDKPKGPSGFLVQELVLRGIVRTPDGFIALVQGPDGKSYPMRVGQKLYDGEITGMDGATVTLNQRYTDEFNRPKVNTVKKSLYPSEEARQ